MILFKRSGDLSVYLEKFRKQGVIIGYVPTMGALHEGHISLIKQCKLETSLTVCSIFINPTQFNNKEDFNKYPVSIEADIQLLEKNNCDVLFLPDHSDIYPEGSIAKRYTIGYLETILEGKFRPGHFQGVCQVVEKLLEIISPDILYLGQKDFQQCMVIRKLIELMKAPIEIRVCATSREADGLAMSSRNLRLNYEQRKQAIFIFKALDLLKKKLAKGELTTLISDASEILISNGFKIDYVEIADATTLETLHIWDGKKKLIALIAAYINDIRLIDNLLLN